jgi:hypothetical protein
MDDAAEYCIDLEKPLRELDKLKTLLIILVTRNTRKQAQ